MAAEIIDGKAIAAEIRAEMKEEAASLKAKGIVPGLAVVIVGEDPASKVYVGQKEKGCEEIGIYSEKHALAADATEGDLLALVNKLNKDDKINGILVQLPLPAHIDEKRVLFAIDPAKDVDGFHPENIGKLVDRKSTFMPCTPHGIMVLIERSGIDIRGKRAVIIGRSNIVGKPIALMLLAKDATVTICHSKTSDLACHAKEADILVVAIGRPEAVKGDVIKEGAVVIDVGVNRLESGKLVGDVEFESASEVAGAITPVPGGVGPMTITMLLKNTIKAAKMAAKVS